MIFDSKNLQLRDCLDWKTERERFVFNSDVPKKTVPTKVETELQKKARIEKQKKRAKNAGKLFKKEKVLANIRLKTSEIKGEIELKKKELQAKIARYRLEKWKPPEDKEKMNVKIDFDKVADTKNAYALYKLILNMKAEGILPDKIEDLNKLKAREDYAKAYLNEERGKKHFGFYYYSDRIWKNGWYTVARGWSKDKHCGKNTENALFKGHKRLGIIPFKAHTHYKSESVIYQLGKNGKDSIESLSEAKSKRQAEDIVGKLNTYQKEYNSEESEDIENARKKLIEAIKAKSEWGYLEPSVVKNLFEMKLIGQGEGNKPILSSGIPLSILKGFFKVNETDGSITQKGVWKAIGEKLYFMFSDVKGEEVYEQVRDLNFSSTERVVEVSDNFKIKTLSSEEALALFKGGKSDIRQLRRDEIRMKYLADENARPENITKDDALFLTKTLKFDDIAFTKKDINTVSTRLQKQLKEKFKDTTIGKEFIQVKKEKFIDKIIQLSTTARWDRIMESIQKNDEWKHIPDDRNLELKYKAADKSNPVAEYVLSGKGVEGIIKKAKKIIKVAKNKAKLAKEKVAEAAKKAKEAAKFGGVSGMILKLMTGIDDPKKLREWMKKNKATGTFYMTISKFLAPIVAGFLGVKGAAKGMGKFPNPKEIIRRMMGLKAGEKINSAELAKKGNNFVFQNEAKLSEDTKIPSGNELLIPKKTGSNMTMKKVGDVMAKKAENYAREAINPLQTVEINKEQYYVVSSNFTILKDETIPVGSIFRKREASAANKTT